MAGVRDNLAVRGAAAEVVAAGRRLIADDPASLATPPGLVRHAFESMGTQIQFLIPEDHPVAVEAVETVRLLFAEWHRRLTRFDGESELSKLNARSGQTAEVTPFLFGVIEASLRAAAATRGLFDPTLLHVLEELGYDRTFALVLPDDVRTVMPGAQRVGGAWRGIRLDRDALTVTLPEGIGLDFGGIAKGMAADSATDALRRLGATPAAIDAGGDIAVTGPMPCAAGWPVAIELPRGTRDVTLYAGALATSGVARRWWRRGGRRMHHLLDPRSGLPVENGIWSVSVAAARCEQAEVAAKAAFVLGVEAGSRFLEANGLSGLFVRDDGRQVEAGRWQGGDGEGPSASAAGAGTGADGSA